MPFLLTRQMRTSVKYQIPATLMLHVLTLMGPTPASVTSAIVGTGSRAQTSMNVMIQQAVT